MSQQHLAKYISMIHRHVARLGLPPQRRSHTCRFDALTGYLSALLRDGLGGNGSCSGLKAAAAGGWPATHIIGKDILRFHAVCAAAVASVAPHTLHPCQLCVILRMGMSSGLMVGCTQAAGWQV
jgi:hypothetical protein